VIIKFTLLHLMEHLQLLMQENQSGSNTVDYLVIAGGGGGGENHGGGGGAGGWRASDGTNSGCYTAGPAPLTGSVPGITLSLTTYPISVGAGGGGGTPSVFGPATVGSNSIFSTITSSGGGGGSGNVVCGPGPWNSGSSGGGGKGEGTPKCAGTGNNPPVSPPQGNPGGTGSPSYTSGGGGSSWRKLDNLLVLLEEMELME
jgi:hypothetical protein